jgi:tetratricopeptide (TPR) repeat protein
MNRPLLALLLGLGLLYLTLLPMLRRMAAETSRLQRRNAAQQAEAARLAGLRRELIGARAKVERAPGDAAAQLELAACCREVGQLDEATRRAELAAGLRPHDPAPLLLLADIQRQRRCYAAAVVAYKAALAIDPANQQGLTGLAFLYSSFAWPRDAERLLEPAVRAAPGNPYLKVALAAAYSQQQDWAAAERLLQQAHRLDPDDPAVWAPLVHLYNQCGREREAATVAHQALALRPNDVSLLNELGEAQYQLHDLPGAASTFHQVIALQPDAIEAHYYIGLCDRSAGKLQAAIRELEYVSQRDPRFGQARFVLGRLYLQTNRVAEGRRLLAEARRSQAQDDERSRLGLLVSTHPHSPDAHWQMALAYQKQGDIPHMIVELRKTLELAPSHPEARRLLQVHSPPRSS